MNKQIAVKQMCLITGTVLFENYPQISTITGYLKSFSHLKLRNVHKQQSWLINTDMDDRFRKWPCSHFVYQTVTIVSVYKRTFVEDKC